MRYSAQMLMPLVCLLISPCYCFGQYGNSLHANGQSVFHGQDFHQLGHPNSDSHSARVQPTYSRQYDSEAYTRPLSQSRNANNRYSNDSIRGYSMSQSGYTNRSVHRTGPTDVQNLRTAQPGRYYRWKTVPGTSEAGYVAHDGSRWKLLKSAGIVEVDRWGRQHTISHKSSGHPHRYIWKIEKGSNARKVAWISRNETTGTISVFYQRPRYSHKSRFYSASVVLEDGIRIVDLTWQRVPDWATEVELVVASKYPRLPAGIHRSTPKKYLPASEYDVVVAKRAKDFLRVTRQLTPQLQAYEEASEPAIALPQQPPQPQNNRIRGSTVAH